MQEKFGICIGPDAFIELDSSSEIKFSRHLIARAPGCCFRSNAHVGAFVEELFQKKEKEEESSEEQQACSHSTDPLFLNKARSLGLRCLI